MYMKNAVNMPHDESNSNDTGENEGTFSIAEYPQLKDMSEGDNITGTWSGNIKSIDNENATVVYSSYELNTENEADRKMSDMMNRGNSPIAKGPTIEEKIAEE